MTCDEIDAINEGILLSAALTDFLDNIRFYYNNEAVKNNLPVRIPHVKFITSDHELLQVYYSNENNFTVPGTFDTRVGLLNYTVNLSQFINRFVSLTWKQQASVNVERYGSDCDV